MKWFFFSLLLIACIPLKAQQDSLAYEELPECFFVVDTVFVVRNEKVESKEPRILVMDTCNSSDLIEMAYWPVPVNNKYMMVHISKYRKELLENNKIYSNHLLTGRYDKGLQTIFKPEESPSVIREGSILDIKEEYQDIKDVFNMLKDSIGNYKLYLHDYYSKTNDMQRFSLVFDGFVSLKAVKEMFKDHNIDFGDFYFAAALSTVTEDPEFEVEHTGNSIRISNARNELDINIYTLNGNCVATISCIKTSDYIIDLSNYNNGIYLVEINGFVYKHIGLR